ncbi:hypothetical protein Bca4012_068290 [Brassica carinata]
MFKFFMDWDEIKKADKKKPSTMWVVSATRIYESCFSFSLYLCLCLIDKLGIKGFNEFFTLLLCANFI